MIAHEVLDHLAEVVPGDGLQIYSVLDQVRELGRANARSVVISTRGAPFLTVATNGKRPRDPIGRSAPMAI